MNNISTVILAGGSGSRIGGGKGLRHLHDKALIDWVLAAISRQSDEVLISIHTDDEDYQRKGCRIVTDRIPHRAGPLAGVQSALYHACWDWVMSVPCDTPFLPDDLTAKLLAAINRTDAEAAVAVVNGQRQPAIALYQRGVLPKLDAYLAAGGRQVHAWLDTLDLVEVPFDDSGAFININSSQELQRANQVLQAGGRYYDVQNAIA